MSPTSSNVTIDAFFSPRKDTVPVESDFLEPQEQAHVFTTLHLSDAKTRQSSWLPSHQDTEHGRMQLTVYRKLLVEILETNPPFNFNQVWEMLGLDSTAVFPTKFLEQAQLFRPADEDLEICLDDLVASWHKLVKDAKIDCISKTLQLVYYQRPPDDEKGKQKAMPLPIPQSGTDREDEDLARAIAESLKEASGIEVGPSNLSMALTLYLPEVGNSENATNLTLGTEDAAFQLALQRSLENTAVASDESFLVLAGRCLHASVSQSGDVWKIPELLSL